MNTDKSDKLVKKWKNSTNPLNRICITAKRKFNSSVEKVFPLLCPTTEYDWLPGWNGQLLHSRSGYAEYNCIFKSNYFGPEEIFVCTRFERNKAVDYSRTSENLCAKLDISLIDNCDGTLTGLWVVTASALNESGNKLIQHPQEAQAHLNAAIDALEYYVNTGEMVSVG